MAAPTGFAKVESVRIVVNEMLKMTENMAITFWAKRLQE
jgi:hypothetical protein